MNAKEERNHNLEIHKMTRSNNELIAKNAALEVECTRLRVAIKQESEKYAAKHAAMMQQVNATMELEREKINALQRQFEKERERLTEDAYKDAVAQRASHMDALGDIKRHLDTRYNEKANENKIALDAAIRQLDEERERIKRDEREQHALLNEEREQVKRQLNEGRERIKRDEKEQLVQFLFHMDLEREKNQCQLEKERALMMEQVHNETVTQRQSNADMLAETKMLLDAKHNKKMNELDIKIQESNEEREQLRKNEEERVVQMNEEREQLRKNEEERLVQMNEEREKIKRYEKEQHEQFLIYMDSERKNAQCQMEKERARMMEQVHNETVAQRQFNEDALAKMKMQLDEKCNTQLNAQLNKNTIAFDSAMRQLEEEREQLKRMLTEERERNMRDDLEREKINTFQRRLEKERELLFEQAQKDDVAQRQSNANALTEAKRQMDAQINEQMNKNKLAFDAAMQQLNEERVQIKRMLTEERERNKQDDLEREKIKTFQHRLEKERELLFEQAQKDAVAQRQSNMDAIAETKRQLDSQNNVQINKNKLAFDAAMQKLNEEQDQLKQHEHNMNESFRKKMQTLQNHFEKERELLAEQARKDDALQRQNNAVILKETKKQYDAQINEQMNKNKIVFDAAMQKLNLDRAKMHDALKREREQLIEQAQKDDMAQKQSNADALAETKKQLDIRFNEQMSKNNAEINKDRDKLKLDHNQLQASRDIFEKEREQLAISIKNLNKDRDKLKLDHIQLHTSYVTLEKELRMSNGALEKERDQLAITVQKLNEELTKIKHDEKQRLIQNSGLMDEISQLKKKLKEDCEKHVRSSNELNQKLKIKCDELQKLNNRLLNTIDKSETAHINNAIDTNYAHMQLIKSLNFSDKRVMIYSHYSDENEVESYNLLTIECVQHYFDYIIILTNCPNKWNIHSPNYNKCHLLTYNMKSDFRNYGVFIMQTAKTLVNASRLCLINDSFVVVDVNTFGYCIKCLFDSENMSHDFIGLTSSHEGIFHLQSYFLCFNSTTVPAIMSYFETHGLPKNHQSAILQYELGITSHLIDKGFSSFAVVSNDDMRHPLNTTCCKWSAVLKDIGIIKRQHFFKKYAYAAMTDANIAVVAENYSYNKHLMHFLKYHGIHVNVE